MRTIRKQYPAISDDIGDLRTQRPLPNEEIDQIDPFLFLNHHGPQVYPPGNRGLPFGPHPHRGFETVTFIVEGSLMHRDTGGHESVIRGGGVQWMTAGRGLEHAELSPEEFLRNGGPLEILQLWVNLPSRLKMTEPKYIGLQKEDLATVDGITKISGEGAPIQSLTGITLMEVEVRDRPVTLDAPRDHNVFFYVVRGEVTAGGEPVRAFHLAHFNDDGDTIEIAGNGLVIFGHAGPYNEPVVSYGPFVMNTQEEIVQAIRDYQSGLFSVPST
jgi:redox-sensitive bicupin YhaK (pirin superfamily)